MIKKIVVVWLVMLMVVGGMIGILSTDAETGSGDAEIRYALQSKSGLTVHDPIYIDCNSNFTSANGVTSGSGTSADPYIIENWDINASTAHGVHIESTDVYFIIRNCVIHDGKNNQNFGVYLDNVDCGIIDSITTYNNYGGIRIYWYSSNNQITNCNAYNNYYGIDIGHSLNSSNNQITKCAFHNNFKGIYLWYSSDTKISNCAIYNNSYGIYLHGYWGYCSYNDIVNCTVYSNSYGIYFSYSPDNEIHYCNLCNNTNYGVYNYNPESQYVANATSNWWGSTSGPYHLATNPNSTGDNVSDNVIYDSWLTEPVNISLSNMPPIALFTFSLTSPTTSDVIQFTDSSFGLGDNIVSWFWDFGDGNTSSEQNPQHKYSAAGNYTVKLTVTDDNGLNATYAKLITVREEGAVTDGGTTNGDTTNGGQQLGSEENKQKFDFNYVIMIVGVIAVCVIIGLVLVKRRGKQPAKVKKEEKKTTQMLRCPKCRQTFRVEAKPKPFPVKCPHCGKEGVIR